MRKAFWAVAALTVVFTFSSLLYMLKASNDDFERQREARKALFEKQLKAEKDKYEAILEDVRRR